MQPVPTKPLESRPAFTMFATRPHRLFPNISSQTEGGSLRKKVGNTFGAFEIIIKMAAHRVWAPDKSAELSAELAPRAAGELRAF